MHPTNAPQTQVSRAAEYFRRWVARWPTVQALAGASQEEVNELWAGVAAILWAHARSGTRESWAGGCCDIG